MRTILFGSFVSSYLLFILTARQRHVYLNSTLYALTYNVVIIKTSCAYLFCVVLHVLFCSRTYLFAANINVQYYNTIQAFFLFFSRCPVDFSNKQTKVLFKLFLTRVSCVYAQGLKNVLIAFPFDILLFLVTHNCQYAFNWWSSLNRQQGTNQVDRTLACISLYPCVFAQYKQSPVV